MAKSRQYQQMSVLVSSTFAFTICFAVWMMFAVIGIPIKTMLSLNETQFGLLAAMPVLTGSLVRIPLGVWTDRYGGRIVLTCVMACTVIPIYLLQFATQYWHFLVLALFVGVAGGSFSVGTPYVARWFTKERQGLAMGIFGAGNSGSALTKFAAPAMILAAGGSWQVVPEYYSYAMALTAVIFWFTSYHDPKHIAPANTTSFKAMFQLLKDEKVLRYSQYYSVVFGGYVGLALWMTKYYIAQYGFTMQTAALLAACFSLPGGVLRALGGWISDKYGAYKTTWGVMWVALTCLFIMSYPNTQMSIETVNGARDFHLGLSVVPFTVLLFVVGIATAVGKASVFKFISDDYTQNIGAVSGIVGLAGGLGGFLLPIMFGALVDLTGIRTSCFMLLFGTVCVSMIWMHWAFRRESMQAAQAALAAKG